MKTRDDVRRGGECVWESGMLPAKTHVVIILLSLLLLFFPQSELPFLFGVLSCQCVWIRHAHVLHCMYEMCAHKM